MTISKRLISILCLLLGVAQARPPTKIIPKPCPSNYRTNTCTACDSWLYQNCDEDDHKAIGNHADSCGFLSAGCYLECQDPDGNGYDKGCGCGKETVCLDCQVSAWGNWSACTKACGGGTQKRTRIITQERQWGGENSCPTLAESRDCNTHCCDRDCETAWSEWSACSKTCGDDRGTQTRRLLITQSPCGGGKACPTHGETCTCTGNNMMMNTEMCKRWNQCKIEAVCKEYDWGKSSRTSTFALYHDTSIMIKYKYCYLDYADRFCPSAEFVNKIKDKSGYTYYTKDAGICNRSQHLKDLLDKGVIKEETRACQPTPCPVDCVVSWSEFSECSEDCGPGKQTRTGTVKTAQVGDGKACGALTEEQDCEIKECPIATPAPAPESKDPTPAPTEPTPTPESKDPTPMPTPETTPAHALAPKITPAHTECPLFEPVENWELSTKRIVQRAVKVFGSCKAKKSAEDCGKHTFCTWKNVGCRNKTKDATDQAKNFLSYVQCACSKFCEEESRKEENKAIAFWQLNVSKVEKAKIRGRCYCRVLGGPQGKRLRLSDRDHTYAGGLTQQNHEVLTGKIPK